MKFFTDKIQLQFCCFCKLCNVNDKFFLWLELMIQTTNNLFPIINCWSLFIYFILLWVLFLPFTCNQCMFIWDMCWAGVLIWGILAASKWGLIPFYYYYFIKQEISLTGKNNGKHYSYLGTRCLPGASSPYFMSVN